VFFLSQWYFQIYTDSIDFFDQQFVSLLLAITGISVIVLLSQLLASLNVNFLKWIGSYSLEIYLLHVLFGSGLRILMQDFMGIENSTMHLLLGTIFGLFFSILFVELVKKIGCSFVFSLPTLKRSNK
jgi:peptidoglycan/LPS O-acetylase OafA/YrhL